MSVKIRLAKTGKKHQISFRIVAADSRAKRDGKYLQILGFYNPYNKPELKIDQEKLNSWIQKGATPTPGVVKLLRTRLNAQEPITSIENQNASVGPKSGA